MPFKKPLDAVLGRAALAPRGGVRCPHPGPVKFQRTQAAPNTRLPCLFSCVVLRLQGWGRPAAMPLGDACGRRSLQQGELWRQGCPVSCWINGNCFVRRAYCHPQARPVLQVEL